tara:strand:+ start:347 stop:679 length:333 start_codon:yes stop_codon:yes gene_type:complete
VNLLINSSSVLIGTVVVSTVDVDVDELVIGGRKYGLFVLSCVNVVLGVAVLVVSVVEEVVAVVRVGSVDSTVLSILFAVEDGIVLLLETSVVIESVVDVFKILLRASSNI